MPGRILTSHRSLLHRRFHQTEVARHNSPPGPATVITGAKTQQNSSALTAEEERQGKISGYAAIIAEWLPRTGLDLCDYGTFFKQVESILDGTRPWLFSEEAPEPHEIDPDEDPWEVINRSKPEGGNLQTAPDLANNAVKWLARWLQRLVPDLEMMKEIIAKAKVLAFTHAQ